MTNDMINSRNRCRSRTVRTSLSRMHAITNKSTRCRRSNKPMLIRWKLALIRRSLICRPKHAKKRTRLRNVTLNSLKI